MNIVKWLPSGNRKKKDLKKNLSFFHIMKFAIAVHLSYIKIFLILNKNSLWIFYPLDSGPNAAQGGTVHDLDAHHHNNVCGSETLLFLFCSQDKDFL